MTSTINVLLVQISSQDCCFTLCIPTPERCNLGVYSKTAVKLRRMCELVIASGFQASHGSHENYLTPLQ